MRWQRKPPKPYVSPNEWHRYFQIGRRCWDMDCVALEWIERRLVKTVCGPGGCWRLFEYRLPEEATG